MSTVIPSIALPDEVTLRQSELADRALAFYKDRLQAQLEPVHDGEGLAIHPDSGDYALAQTPTHASRALWQRHPEGGIVSTRVGPTPDFALAARILAGRIAPTLHDTSAVASSAASETEA